MRIGFVSPLFSLVLLATGVRAADTFDAALEQASLEYAKRLGAAGDELVILLEH